MFRVGYVTVSAKIPKKLEELLDEYNTKPDPIIRRALEEEIRKQMLKELEILSKEVMSEISEISGEEIVKLIREDREDR
uniref:CopG family transcriptional regulator n=2 Tax=Ignisphaera aggregans TaxID=334771 RepID=A0A7J3JQB8_9CREN